MVCVRVAPAISAGKIENRRSLIYSLKVSVTCHCSCSHMMSMNELRSPLPIIINRQIGCSIFRQLIFFLLFFSSPPSIDHWWWFPQTQVRPFSNRFNKFSIDESDKQKKVVYHWMAPADNHLLIEVVAHRVPSMENYDVIYHNRYDSVEIRAGPIDGTTSMPTVLRYFPLARLMCRFSIFAHQVSPRWARITCKQKQYFACGFSLNVRHSSWVCWLIPCEIPNALSTFAKTTASWRRWRQLRKRIFTRCAKHVRVIVDVDVQYTYTVCTQPTVNRILSTSNARHRIRAPNMNKQKNKKHK